MRSTGEAEVTSETGDSIPFFSSFDTYGQNSRQHLTRRFLSQHNQAQTHPANQIQDRVEHSLPTIPSQSVCHHETQHTSSHVLPGCNLTST